MENYAPTLRGLRLYVGITRQVDQEVENYAPTLRGLRLIRLRDAGISGYVVENYAPTLRGLRHDAPYQLRGVAA